ncbi:MAG: YlxR family protein, partial [Candidatus Obscuribacterales bacterium]|nr:YlxR family protein [Candidatus Obscuribacterales bacterium]
MARESRPGTSSSAGSELSHKVRDSGQKRAAACSEGQASSKGAGATVESAAHSSSKIKAGADKRELKHARLCLVCRQYFSQDRLLRLTAESTSGSVVLNQAQRGTARVCGRSAYVCCALSCVEAALKGTRLKQALQGRKLKGAPQKRSVAWPLESQLIHTMRT